MNFKFLRIFRFASGTLVSKLVSSPPHDLSSISYGTVYLSKTIQAQGEHALSSFNPRKAVFFFATSKAGGGGFYRKSRNIGNGQ